ncbi:MAG TPA: hypothetical protein VK646_13440 [Actinomycetota bacterium]|nr:hypothetical protein [Actinomycetota bacterium]
MPAAGDPATSAGGRWGPFLLWTVYGFATGFAVFAVAPAALLLVLLAVVGLAVRPALRAGAPGLITGAGGVSLLVAFLQRRGPGTVCWHTATAVGCDQYLNPWPWLVVGLVLVVAGIVVHVRVMRAA